MQGDQQYQTYIPPLTKINKTIIIATAAIFIISSILTLSFKNFSLAQYIGLSIGMLTKGHLYQLFTYPFIQDGLLSFIFNALIIWFVGGDIEHELGKRLYLSLLITTVLGAAITYISIIVIFFKDSLLVSSIPFMGLSGICYSLLLIYSFLYGDRPLLFMLIFPMKAKYFCWLLIGIELYMSIFSASSKTSFGHLGAMLFAFLFFRYATKVRKIWSYTSSKISPFGDPRGGRGGSGSKSKGGHLHIVKGDDDDSYNSQSNNGPKYWQ
ncbi:MAG: rhomboid family intramembrane serine protease [Oligoflexia bacterium]|nr:rhomboid family intramembrane serine protease [Oligoflexia bacterium]